MKGEIESITRILDQNQINLFKERNCEFCTNYSSIGICDFDEGDVSDTIISCIENERFCVKMSIVSSK